MAQPVSPRGVHITFVLGGGTPERLCRDVDWPLVPRIGEVLPVETGQDTRTPFHVATVHWRDDGSAEVLFANHCCQRSGHTSLTTVTGENALQERLATNLGKVSAGERIRLAAR